MRLEILVGMQIRILNGQSSGLFLNESFEKRYVMTVEDFDVHFNEHFESHLFGNGALSLLGGILVIFVPPPPLSPFRFCNSFFCLCVCIFVCICVHI